MEWDIKQRIDLSSGHPELVAWHKVLMLPGDGFAHTWEITVYKSGVFADLTGFTVEGCFVRSDDVTIYVSGTITGSVLRVTLNTACYNKDGTLRGLMRITNGTSSITIAETYFAVRRPLGSATLVPENIVPSLQAILDDMDVVTSAVETATGASASATAAADAAALSALAADASDDNAILSKQAAAASATAANTSAAAAALSATNSANSATGSAASAATSLTSKNAADAAKVAAQTAETNAETAETNAEAAQILTEAAKVAAQAAKTSAETAETNAETAQTAAAASASAASTSATNSAGSASAATASKITAQTAETNASGSATGAAGSATAANTSKVAAQTAASEAVTSKNAAAASMNTAETHKVAAALSATNAAANAASSLTNTNLATTKASESAASAAAAALSESGVDSDRIDAEAAAAAALASKTAALGSQTSSELANTAAQQAKTDAIAAKTAASGHMDAAAVSAAAALASKNAAATSASGAATSAGTATTKAQEAVASSTATAISASNANTSAVNAEASASSALASKQATAADKIAMEAARIAAQISESNALTSQTLSQTAASNAAASEENASLSAAAAAHSELILQGFVVEISNHEHSFTQIPDLPTSFPASDVSDWAKEGSKPVYTPAEVGAAPEIHTHAYAATSHTHTKANITDFAHTHLKADITDFTHTHLKANITDFPVSMPASDVSAWAKAATKPTYTNTEVGAAATSHGSHVPTTATANNAIFLRNDNSWQTVTPANIGAAAASHTHAYAASVHVHVKADITDFAHTHAKADITDFPASLPASDVSAWAKAASKPTYTNTEVGAAATVHTHVKANITDFPTSLPASDVSAWAKAATKPTYTAAEVGAASTSHGNHVPTVGTANNAIFLRNDNSWQTITPANIGAAATSHTHLKANITDFAHTHAKVDITDFPTSLPASDVSAWAKAAAKPTYTNTEVGAAATVHTHVQANITDFPSSMPASDVSAWAKAVNKPVYTAAEVGAAASSHPHGNLTNDGKIGTVAGMHLITSTGGLVEAKDMANVGWNLVRNSDFSQGFAEWLPYNYPTLAVTNTSILDGTKHVVEMTVLANNGNGFAGVYQLIPYSADANINYVLSYWMRLSDAAITLHAGRSFGIIQQYAVNGITSVASDVVIPFSAFTLSNGVWARGAIPVNIVATCKVIKIVMFIRNDLATLNSCRISNVQLEQGSIPTAWAFPSQDVIRNTNLLHNWDFRNPVNQRGITGVYSTTNTYFLDRWTADWGSVTVNAGSLYMPSGSYLGQRIEGLLLKGKVVTFSVLKLDGTIAKVTVAVPTTNNSWSNNTFPGVGGVNLYCDSAGFFRFQMTSNAIISILAIKLELGAVSTLAYDAPAEYGTEMLKCRRYFRNDLQSLYIPIYTSTVACIFQVNLNPPMRVIPTITIPDLTSLIYMRAIGTYTPTSAIVANASVSRYMHDFAGSFGGGTLPTINQDSPAINRISASADL